MIKKKIKSKVLARLFKSKEEFCVTFIFMFLDELVKEDIITKRQKGEAHMYINRHIDDNR